MSDSILTKMTAEAAGRLLIKKSVLGLLCMSMLTNAVLALYLIVKTDESKVVVIAPESAEPYVAMNDKVSANLLERFSVSALNSALNATPQTASFQAETFLKYVAPESYAEIASILRRGAAELERNQASTAFFPHASRVDTENLTVCLTGERKTMIGKAVTHSQTVNVCLTTAARMGRLWITRIHQTEAKGAAASN